MLDRLVETFCAVDDFCQAFVPQWEAYLLGTSSRGFSLTDPNAAESTRGCSDSIRPLAPYRGQQWRAAGHAQSERVHLPRGRVTAGLPTPQSNLSALCCTGGGTVPQLLSKLRLGAEVLHAIDQHFLRDERVRYSRNAVRTVCLYCAMVQSQKACYA